MPERLSIDMRRIVCLVCLLIVALVFAGFPLLAQTPTISNIVLTPSASSPDHATVNLSFQTSVQSYCSFGFGTSSGSYTYQGGSGQNFQDPFTLLWLCNMNIGGLAPSTTYYINPQARPSANSVTGLCQVGASCGAVEQVYTTAALPAIHPAPPIAPSVWTPAEPNTSGYTVVAMQAATSSGTDTQGWAYAIGDCVATSNVAAPGGGHWSASIVANDTFRTVFNKIWYDTVIEGAGGTKCTVPPDLSSGFKPGIILPVYSPTGGSNDWVVIRTHISNVSDFPPFGMRTGPQYASKLWTISATTPNVGSTPPQGPGTNPTNDAYTAQLFDCYQVACSHYYFENQIWTHEYNSTLYPAGVTDPAGFGNYFRAVPGGLNNSPTPDHMVLDRIYMQAQPFPSRETSLISPGGNYWAVINCYMESNTWIQGVYPQTNPVISANVITVPFSYFQQNQFDNTPLGMQYIAGYNGSSTTTLTINNGTQHFFMQAGLSFSPGDTIELFTTDPSGEVENGTLSFMMMGAVTTYNNSTGETFSNITFNANPNNTFSNWKITRPATITFSGVSAYTGNVFFWTGGSTMTVDYQTAAGVSASCSPASYCTIMNEASPSFNSVPATSLYYISGNFNGSGTFVMTYSAPDIASPSQISRFRPIGVYLNGGINGIYDNNFITAIGQTVYNDSGLGMISDIAWTHNYFYFPRSKMQYSGQWDGYGYTFRNVIETKQMIRAQYNGNIFDGSASYQNAGNPLFLIAVWATAESTGLQDILASGNIFKHLSAGTQVACGGAQINSDGPCVGRIQITNNFWLDLNRDLYNNGGGGFASGVFALYPLAEDVNFSNNTVGLTKGPGPSLIYSGGAATSKTTVMGEGLAFNHNLLLTSLGDEEDVIGSLDGGQNSAYSNFPTNPTAAPDVTFGAAGAWKSVLDTNFIHTGASITPSWTMGGNVIVGAQTERGFIPWTDLTSYGITTNIVNLWPSNDTTSDFPGSSVDPWASTRCTGSGATMANRFTCIGWSATLDPTNGNPLNYPAVPTVYNPATSGANVTTVNQTAGVVNNIALSTVATALQIAYVAPDSRACSADISPTGAGTWTRMTDSGGAYARALSFTGLSAATAYDYRLMCYFDQQAAYEFLASQVTSGTITTAASATRTVNTTFTLPATATKVVVSFQPLTGSPVSATCTTSPCVVTSVPVGIDARTMTFQTPGSVTVGVPGTVNVTIN